MKFATKGIISTYDIFIDLSGSRVRGRNTENLIVEKAIETAGYQQKRYDIMKFIYDEKYIVFNNVGKGRSITSFCTFRMDKLKGTF